MSPLRQLFLAVALAALVGAAWYRSRVFREPPPPAPVKVALVTGGSGPYWQLAVNGARAAAREFNVSLQVEIPSGAESLPEQTKILERLESADVAGVAVSPVDAEGQRALIDSMATKMFIVTFDSDAPDSKRQGYVGTSNFAAGRVCARLVGQALPNGGKVAVLLANLTKDNLLDRKGGFQEALYYMQSETDDDAQAPAIEVVGFFVDDGDDAKCAALVRKTLTEHPDLKCFVGMNARHGPVLMETLEDEGQLGKIKIVAFDEAEATLDGIAAGHVEATLVQDPYRYGYEAVRMLASLSRSDENALPLGPATFSVNVATVRQENLDEYRAKVESRRKAEEKADADAESA
jgi:ribose transport system substrate-binding protein